MEKKKRYKLIVTPLFTIKKEIIEEEKDTQKENAHEVSSK